MKCTVSLSKPTIAKQDVMSQTSGCLKRILVLKSTNNYIRQTTKRLTVKAKK